MKNALQLLFEGRSLSRLEAYRAMGLLISGRASPEQAAAFLGALRAKRETLPELTGFVQAMRERMIAVHSSRAPVLDTCGTGGSGTDAFNISSAVAFVVAGAGLAVAKHGNRSVSSQCGSADVFEALGVPIDLSPADAGRCLDEVGLGFFYAPLYHPALKNVGPVRKAIGVRTVLNLLGPLVNPVTQVRRQVIGVPDRHFGRLMIEVLRDLESEEVMVVTGEGGLDEIALSGPTEISHLKNGRIEHLTIEPTQAGLVCAPLEAIRGGDARTNAGILEGILKNELPGPKRDVVLLNASAALQVGGLAEDFRGGAKLAAQVIESGRAFAVLERLRRFR